MNEEKDINKKGTAESGGTESIVERRSGEWRGQAN